MSTRIKLTPGIGEVGIYVVAPPFTLSGDIEYECVGITNYRALYNQRLVSRSLYKAMAIPDNIYDEDKALDAKLVTLSSPGEPDYIIPDTFLVKLPIKGGVRYHQKLVSCNLGYLPTNTDITDLISTLEATTKAAIGIDVTFDKYVYDTIELVDLNEHAVLTANRQTAKSQDKSTFQTITEMQAKIDALEATLAIYKQHIIDTV